MARIARSLAHADTANPACSARGRDTKRLTCTAQTGGSGNEYGILDWERDAPRHPLPRASVCDGPVG